MKSSTAKVPSTQTPSDNALKFPLRLVPSYFHPYLELSRVDKPTGIYLMFYPFAWGLTMAAYSTRMAFPVYLKELALSFFYAFIIRSSCCTFNDIVDRKFDAAVERTRRRPLPSGRISLSNAVTWLIIQWIVGSAFFYFTLHNRLALEAAYFQLFPLFAVYPLLKRVTHWPQAWLGFAMNFGFITSWIASTQQANSAVIVAMMIGSWSWTVMYDTIYACQDLKDDLKCGVKSTAIIFGTWIKPVLVFLGSTFVVMLALAGKFNHQGPWYFGVSVGGTAAHIIWQFMTVDLEVPTSCWANFKSNGQLGCVVLCGEMLDYLTAVNAAT